MDSICSEGVTGKAGLSFLRGTVVPVWPEPDEAALQRLVANGYARATSNYRSANTFTTGGCDPLPGYPTHRSIPAVSSAATSPTSPTLELLS